MNEVDVESVRPYLLSFAGLVTKFSAADKSHICESILIRRGWEGHTLCNIIPQKYTFYSFGILTDYSFDLSLGDNFSCTGFAADPTVIHPSKLHALVTFHQIGAKMLKQDENK